MRFTRETATKEGREQEMVSRNKSPFSVAKKHRMRRKNVEILGALRFGPHCRAMPHRGASLSLRSRLGVTVAGDTGAVRDITRGRL